MKSCTSRTVFFELLRISPVTVPSPWTPSFSIVRTLPACCCERTVCDSDVFGQSARTRPNRSETNIIQICVCFDVNVIIVTSSYRFIVCLHSRRQRKRSLIHLRYLRFLL